MPPLTPPNTLPVIADGIPQELRVLPHHQAMLDASAIAPEVAAERGYWSARTRAELSRLGFADYQALAPALVMNEKLLVDVVEAARLCAVSRAHLYQRVMDGSIASIKIGRARRIPMEALRTWIARELESAPGQAAQR